MWLVVKGYGNDGLGCCNSALCGAHGAFAPTLTSVCCWGFGATRGGMLVRDNVATGRGHRCRQ